MAQMESNSITIQQSIQNLRQTMSQLEAHLSQKNDQHSQSLLHTLQNHQQEFKRLEVEATTQESTLSQQEQQEIVKMTQEMQQMYQQTLTRIQNPSAETSSKKVYTLDNNSYYQTLLTLMNLSYGITNAVLLANNTDAKYECGPAIWYCILLLCISHFMIFADKFTNTDKFDSNGKRLITWDTINQITQSDNRRDIWKAFNIIGCVWACICLYDTRNSCIDVFESDYSNLWTMIKVEVYTFFGLLAIAMLRICTVTVRRSRTVRVQQSAPSQPLTSNSINLTDVGTVPTMTRVPTGELYGTSFTQPPPIDQSVIG
jgi:hypothetical protein